MATLEYSTMKTWYLHLKCCFYLVYKLIYMYFRFTWTPSLISNFHSRCAAYIVQSGTLGMPDHEHMVFALGILSVYGLQHDVHVLPVIAVAILDFQTFGFISKILKIRIKLNLHSLLCHKFFVCTTWIWHVTADRPVLETKKIQNNFWKWLKCHHVNIYISG